MKILIIALTIGMSANLAIAECTNFMDAFQKHQVIMKGMFDLNLNGKLNAETADAIGNRVNKGQEAQNSEDYNKACDIYDSIIKDYDFKDSLAPNQESQLDGKDANNQDADGVTEDKASSKAEVPESAEESTSQPSSE